MNKKIISIIGSNGMLSCFLTKVYYNNNNQVDVYGLNPPTDYNCDNFIMINLLKDQLDYQQLIKSDMIFYASGAGVQAALKTDSSLIYTLNVFVPVEITIQLKKLNYRGIFVSFGSYMEIGLNNENGKAFTEDDIVLSSNPVTNDYALSKRIYGRYMRDFNADYIFWHFILPNMFSYNDIKPGTRLIPYTLQYLQAVKRGENPKKPDFSEGTQTREFILMEDISQVLNKAIEKQLHSGIYNIGGGDFMSIRNLLERIFAIYKIECKDEFFGKEIRRDGDIKSLKLNADKLKKAIDYLPSTKIEDIIKPNEVCL
jgi:nucleoside-diphosphate-sugar epimerase